MSKSVLDDARPYVLDDDFEQLVVVLSCVNASFWTKVGRELDPERMPSEEAKLVLGEAQALYKTTDQPPLAAAVKQRLTMKCDEGKLKRSKLTLCCDYLRLGYDPRQAVVDNAVAELVPMLRRLNSQRVAMAAAGDYSSGKDSFDETFDLIQRVRRIGEDETPNDDNDEGIDLMSDAGYAFDEIRQLKTLERLPFGIPELDVLTGGGGWRGSLILVMASTGDGKSQTIGHVCCHAIRCGRKVALATLEDDRPLYNSRIAANFLDVPFEQIRADPDSYEQPFVTALRRAAGKSGGSFRIKYFNPGSTTFDEIVQWAEKGEFDLLAIDYLDKLKGKKKSESGYKEGLDIAESMRIYAGPKGRNRWIVTGSQAKRRQDRKRLLDTDDVADSMHKVRVPQLVVTLNYDKDTEMVTYGIAKNRMGKGRVDTGPIPHDWAKGRAVPF